MDKELTEKLAKISSARKKRTLLGAILVSLSLILTQIAILILIGVIDLGIVFAVMLIIVSPLFLAIGLYLILHTPPIVLE
ncbi:hypothetical protein [Methanotorris igneus]|uniref:Uncharacterized protein n=1 Tax=Methanotorris igneus (strain DSM 5666 / JCM 11834 / Kol 5) TaxID=880724 RepID=F6BEN8_METIK|nr:hypothetical protein [Methanotorris igneus]AEF96835.1 hypothetical protein Metig_1298 [Methanotorris igneus Kol 5]